MTLIQSVATVHPKASASDYAIEMLIAQDRLPRNGGKIRFEPGDYDFRSAFWSYLPNLEISKRGAATIYRKTNPDQNIPLIASTMPRNSIDGLTVHGDIWSQSAEISFSGDETRITNITGHNGNKQLIEYGGKFPLLEAIRLYYPPVDRYWTFPYNVGPIQIFQGMHGILAAGNVYTYGGVIRNCYIEGTRGPAIFAGGDDSLVEDNITVNCHLGWNYTANAAHIPCGGGHIGIAPTLYTPRPKRVTFRNNKSRHTGNNNIVLMQNGAPIDQKAWASGIEVDSAEDVLLDGNVSEMMPGGGVSISGGAARVTIKNQTSRLNGAVYPGSINGYGIHVGLAYQVTIEGYQLQGNANGGIKVSSSAQDVLIGLGWMQGNGPSGVAHIIDEGIRTKILEGAYSWSGQWPKKL